MPRDYRRAKEERGGARVVYRSDRQPPKPRKRRLSKEEALDADARNQHFQNIHRMRRVHEAALRAEERKRNA